MTDDTITIPADHALRRFELPFEPTVIRTPAGAIIASLGSASDDPDRELATVLAGVERELAAPRTLVEIVRQSGQIRFADLCAPAQPETYALPSPVTWCFHAGAAASVMASPARRRTLFERMHAIARTQVLQRISMIDSGTPAVRLLADVAHGLGAHVGQPDASHGGHAVWIEVTRPSAPAIVCVAVSRELTPDEQPGHPRGALAQLELGELGERIDRIDVAAPVISYRSPRLLEIMLAAEADPNATAAILAEVLARDLPVFVIRFEHAVEIRTFHGEQALPIFADAKAVQQSAAAVGHAEGAYKPVPVSAERMVTYAAREKLALAIGLFRDATTPMWAVISSAAVAALASTLARAAN